MSSPLAGLEYIVTFCSASDGYADVLHLTVRHAFADDGSFTTEVLGDGNKVTGLVYRDRSDDSMHTVELEGIFVQIGLLPNTEWLKDAIALSPRGEIEIDVRGETSQPGIFAAGDCTTVPYKQIVIAMGAGSTAGLSAFDYLIRLPATEEVEAQAA